MLYEPERHEKLRDVPWDPARAHAAIAAIARDTESHFDPLQLWPIHPRDRTDLVRVPSYKSLFWGAAGVAWALDYLAEEGAVSLSRDYDYELIHAEYLAAPDSISVAPSYLLGESGVLLAGWRRGGGSGAVADRLGRLIAENVTHPANDLMLGAPGTLLAALFLFEWTGEDRWRALFRETADHVWAAWGETAWGEAPDQSGHLWTQQLFGAVAAHLGALHGFAGNVSPLLRGAHLLPKSQASDLRRRCVSVLERTALREGDQANWPQSVGLHRTGRTANLVQWCQGAPGVISSLRHFPAGEASQLEALILRGGELTWKAGPLTKGPGLCHGTAGNGTALLELHRRTGDSQWLERARAFAMHAIGQYEQMWSRDGARVVLPLHGRSGPRRLPLALHPG